MANRRLRILNHRLTRRPAGVYVVAVDHQPSRPRMDVRRLVYAQRWSSGRCDYHGCIPSSLTPALPPSTGGHTNGAGRDIPGRRRCWRRCSALVTYSLSADTEPTAISTSTDRRYLLTTEGSTSPVKRAANADPGVAPPAELISYAVAKRKRKPHHWATHNRVHPAHRNRTTSNHAIQRDEPRARGVALRADPFHGPVAQHDRYTARLHNH